MGYLGTPPQSGFITTAKQRVTSSTNNYVDLDHAISSIADVIVFVNFVKQDTTNLTLTTSTRITLGGTLVSSDIVEIHYLGKAVNTQTPATGTVTNDMLAGSIANSKLANSSITLNGSAVSLGGSATVGGDNKPILSVGLSSTQNLTDNTWATLVFQTELLDADNIYNNSTGIATPTAGTYLMIFAANVGGSASQALDNCGVKFLINSTVYAEQSMNQGGNAGRYGNLVTSLIFTFNGSQTVACQAYADITSGTPNVFGGGTERFGATFQMVKLIT